ncbi:uncharacterized protein LOC130630202 [Hydractinia symbiolongicarpus]|uniref:uncharacterized protein LOC130630202 n=1 Tax=Hydractinia symbiolongicarpus TaxID=13093 RepID=UPI00254FA1AA|nr:uncharacterized protein LOC130630202 [Hydractinia symbiolongicarpus]
MKSLKFSLHIILSIKWLPIFGENASKGKLNFVANKQANLDDWKVSVNKNDELTLKIVVVTEDNSEGLDVNDNDSANLLEIDSKLFRSKRSSTDIKTTNTLSYICPLCEKVFHRCSVLKAHMETHPDGPVITKSKAFCNEEVDNEKVEVKNEKEVQQNKAVVKRDSGGGNKTFNCSVCMDSFDSKRLFVSHIT